MSPFANLPVAWLAALSVLAGVALSAETQWNYTAETNTWQYDRNLHTAIALKTENVYHECANYCTLRDVATFRYVVIVKFFVHFGRFGRLI